MCVNLRCFLGLISWSFPRVLEHRCASWSCLSVCLSIYLSIYPAPTPPSPQMISTICPLDLVSPLMFWLLFGLMMLLSTVVFIIESMIPNICLFFFLLLDFCCFKCQVFCWNNCKIRNAQGKLMKARINVKEMKIIYSSIYCLATYHLSIVCLLSLSAQLPSIDKILLL